MRLSAAVNAEYAEYTDHTNNLFDHLYGALEDSLYFLCDENTMDLESSTVDRLLRNSSLSDAQVAAVLSALVKI